MAEDPRPLRIGTRGSDLALWQAHHVQGRLPGGADIQIIKTQGDRIQHLPLDKVEGKGFFTKELEAALLQSTVDLAVHSYKDLPIESPPGLEIVAVPERGPVRDCLVMRRDAGDSKAPWGLRQGARVGTSSIRRQAQLLSRRPDLEMVDIRGNVPTRLQRAASGELDAVMLAEAGVTRLELDQRDDIDIVWLEVGDVCPAPAQGALAVQIRSTDTDTAARLQPLHHAPTAAAVHWERELLGQFGGGCHLPLGAHCAAVADGFHLQALVCAPDGSERLEAQAHDPDGAKVVQQVHHTLMAQGADRYLPSA